MKVLKRAGKEPVKDALQCLRISVRVLEVNDP